MKKKILLFIALIVLLQVSVINLYAETPGSTGFSFLKVPTGARNNAMGSTGAAMLSGAFSAYYNPALTANDTLTNISFMHQEYIFDTRREFVGVVTPLVGGGLSLGFDYLKVSDIESRTGPSPAPIEYFDAQDILFYLGYGLNVAKQVSVGANAKYTAEKIATETASTFLFDLGVLFKATPKINLGAAVKNLGKNPKFKNEEIELPLTISTGASLKLKQSTINADLNASKNNDMQFSFGAEHIIADIFALRSGYKVNFDEEDLSFGAGFKHKIWEIDYAFVPFKSGLGSSHRFALTLQL